MMKNVLGHVKTRRKPMITENHVVKIEQIDTMPKKKIVVIVGVIEVMMKRFANVKMEARNVKKIVHDDRMIVKTKHATRNMIPTVKTQSAHENKRTIARIEVAVRGAMTIA